MLNETKETISGRMIRTASEVWGFSDTQDVNSFDPLVAMIFAALAEELYKISVDIKKTDARLVEKLHELIFSQQEFTHSPAHAIAKAQPQQARVEISENNQFYYRMKVPATIGKETVYQDKDVYFTPTSVSNLFKAEVKYLAAGKHFFEIADRVKEPIAEWDSSLPADYSKLYAGLQIDNLLDKLDGLSLMFSTRNRIYEDTLHHLMVGATFLLNGKEIQMSKGFEVKSENSDNALAELLRKDSDISYRACQYINDFYKSRFITVACNNYYLKSFKPEDGKELRLNEGFPAKTISALPKDIYWLEVRFSQPLPSELLHEINVFTNCFPIINRELNEFSQSLTKGVNVIPLSSPNLFFDVKRVADSKGTMYEPLHASGSNKADEEGYYVRQGGVARFDSREAVEVIQNLIELVRDERAGFSVLGADMVASELKQLDQILNRLQTRIENSNVKQEAGSYLLLRCKPDYERANIQFWSTCGEEANNIRPDSHLSLQRGTELNSNSIVLITGTSGGRQKLSGEEKMNKLRRALLSKGRVVTAEDIKALCFEEYGTMLQRVELSKGVIIDPAPEKGFMRTIDVHLYLKKQIRQTQEEQNQKVDAIKIRLKQESVNLLPYRIEVHQ
jgi:hypothetical protein